MTPSTSTADGIEQLWNRQVDWLEVILSVMNWELFFSAMHDHPKNLTSWGKLISSVKLVQKPDFSLIGGVGMPLRLSKS